MNDSFTTRRMRDSLRQRCGAEAMRLIVLAATSLTASLAFAGPGDLDITFSADGKRTLSFFNENSRAEAVMVRPDGRIVIAGTCSLTPRAFCITQLSATGTLDLTFGSQGNGVEIVAIGSDGNNVTAAAMQPDGKVVVAGHCLSGTRTDFCLARFTLGGRLDSSFSGNGLLATNVSASDDFANAIALQADGKIVLAGQCGTNFCVARYLPNGELDSSFSGNGLLTTTISFTNKANAVAVQPDGKIIVAGECSETSSLSNAEGCVIRYTSTGDIDAGFPIAEALIGSAPSRVRAILLQPDGRFILVGDCSGLDDDGVCLHRRNTDGSFDLTLNAFPQSGVLLKPVAATIQPDGKFAVAAFKLSSARFVLALYNSDGSLDKSFAADGIAEADFTGTEDTANALALQPDRKLVVAGECQIFAAGLPTDMCIARFEAATKGYRECSLDLDGDGKVLATTDSLIHTRIALGITGSAVVGGITFPANATRNSWSEIRTFLVTQCGMTIAP
jgi:uncharacterized delta-60 repeat protein